MAERGTALVVGGSAGIGLAIAEEFARHGHDLVLVARDEARLSAVCDMLAARHGVRVERIALDAAAADGPSRLEAALDARGVQPAYAVIGVGNWHSGPAEELDAEDLGRLLAVNVVAHHALQRMLLPRIPPGGGLLFVGSLAGCLPVPGLSAYAASKACLQTMVLALRQEAAGRGRNICLLAPGLVDTGFIPRSAHSRWRWLGDLLSSSSETVARAAYRGLKADVPVIVPGLAWRLLWLLMRMAPDVLVRAVTGASWRHLARARASQSAGT